MNTHLIALATSEFPVAWHWMTYKMHSLSGFGETLLMAYGLFWVQNTARKGFFATLKGELDALASLITAFRHWRQRRKADPPDTAASRSKTPAAPEERETARRAKAPNAPPTPREDPQLRQHRNTR